MSNAVPLLVRKIQEFFSAVNLQQEYEMVKPHTDEKFAEKIRQTIYPKMFTIYWGQKAEEYKSPIVASHPFSYVDWKTMEQVRDGQFFMDELQLDQIDKLCLNICPNI